MKKFICLSLILIGFVSAALAQDEGNIEKRERIARSNNIFFDFGPSFTLGKNIGDYSTGFNLELGWTKRLNRVFSVGPSISYIKFKYDPAVTSANGGDAFVGFGDPNDWQTKYDLTNEESDFLFGYIINLKGGDLSLASLGLNLKLNLVPIKENTKVSIYGFAKPFVTLASRTEVRGSDERYFYQTFEDDNGTPSDEFDDLLYLNTEDDQWYADGYQGEWGPESWEALKSDTEITGGIFVGPGIELFPTRKFTAFVQASFGYTFPVTFVSTSSYDNTLEDYVNEKFPMIKKGFPSVNVQFGASLNF
jgi:hypothetical protein